MKKCSEFSSKEKYYYFSEIITACPNQGSPNTTYPSSDRQIVNLLHHQVLLTVRGTLVLIGMIHPGQRSKNRCCEPIETLKYLS